MGLHVECVESKFKQWSRFEKNIIKKNLLIDLNHAECLIENYTNDIRQTKLF